MSRSDDRCVLTVDSIPAEATLVVYNGHDDEVARRRGVPSADMELPKGLYTIRTVVAGAMAEAIVRLDAPHRVPAPEPLRYSAAPLDGVSSALTHEYYSLTSERASTNDTRGPIAPEATATAGLFVFVRAVNRDRYRGEHLGDQLYVTDETGALLLGFEDGSTAHDATYGYRYLTCKAAPGSYRLRVDGEKGRDAALQLLSGWQTQVFVLHDGRSPRLDSMRVFLSRLDTPFDPKDSVANAVDEGLHLLHNGTTAIPDRLLHLLLDQKFTNPMLGCIGGHLLARQIRRGDNKDPRRAERLRLLNTVVGNLQALASESADVQALQILNATLNVTPIQVSPLASVPMLRAGLVGVVGAAATKPELIADDSLADWVSERLLSDTPWVTWKPVETEVAAPSPPERRAGTTRDLISEPVVGEGGASFFPGVLAGAGMTGGTASHIDRDRFVRPVEEAPPEPDWVQTALLEHLSRQLTLERSSLAVTIETHKVAARLGVTQSAVRRAFEGLKEIRAQLLLQALGNDRAADILTAAKGNHLRVADVLSLSP